MEENNIKSAVGKDQHKEGRVKFFTSQQIEETKETVFYNPVKVFNRDISLLATFVHCQNEKKRIGDTFKGLHFLDALSASG